MLIRRTFAVGRLRCNCSILGDSQTGLGIVIDPGDDIDTIVSEITAAQLRIVAIVHTHAHLDHVGATAALGRITGAATYLHQGDDFLYQNLAMQAYFLGMPTPQETAPIDKPLVDASSIAFGQYELGILHTPGHTPGSVCFWLGSHELCFSGDTLFHGGVGRTDLPGGDSHTLVQSIQQRLYTLPKAAQVIPGHGAFTSIDYECTTNPFVRLS